MSDPENFLTRWSRRKRADEADQSSQDEAERERVDAPAPESQAETSTPAEPVFDLAKLPSIESITADTDIRAFLAPGVPAELRLAALRRAWVADPKVRDFVGLADYDWDFNTPGAIHGFGPLEMTDELRREVLRIVGGLPAEPEPAPTVDPGASPAMPAAEKVETSAPPDATEKVSAMDRGYASEEPAKKSDEAIGAGAMLHRSDDVASQQAPAQPQQSSASGVRRGHGGALPS